ncbi:hypothetical protein F2Q69_00044479 [Brassica cretica]|uniref:Translation elongation factor EF1B beta/delta subunit guanine nucleotide exchange domain-containing protein n=1 Tax=Brassica cretica TaxID=69181 RepID=A0A8S9NBM9_BRACR|nr:hypothetical protein F2Q69_00044479 [Brassica cretica]
MAVTFSDLHTEQGVKSVEEHLAGKTYISGDQLSVDDVKVYAAIVEKPSDAFPNASKWYDCVASHLAKSFPGKAVGVSIGGSAAAAPAQAEAPAADDDDDMDLFGDETEEEKKAAEEREASKKDTKKPKESGKSSVLMEVKPWDDETDMKKLEECVRAVEMPGLLWGASELGSKTTVGPHCMLGEGSQVGDKCSVKIKVRKELLPENEQSGGGEE